MCDRLLVGLERVARLAVRATSPSAGDLGQVGRPRRRRCRRPSASCRSSQRGRASPHRPSAVRRVVRPISSARMSRWIERLAGGEQREAPVGDLAELAADDEQRVGLPRSDRWRCGRSGRTGRPRADRCRRSRPCRSSCARPGCRSASASASQRVGASERWTPPPASISGRSALASSAAARSTSLGRRPRAARRARSRRRRRPQKSASAKSYVAVADVLRHVEHDRARPAARSRPRRRGAPARECARSPRRGSAPCTRARGSRPGAPPASCSSRRARGWRRRRCATIGHAGVERLDEAGDEVRRARPERRVAHAGPAGHARRRRRPRTRRSARR